MRTSRHPSTRLPLWAAMVALAIVMIGLAVLLVTAASPGGRVFRSPPSRAQAQEIVGDQSEQPLLGYYVWDDTPWVLFLQRPTNRVILDHLEWQWVARPPGWQLSGHWLDGPATEAPAGLQADLCTAPVCDGPALAVFGQINAPEITTLEIQVDGAWHQFPVSYPGYAVMLTGVNTRPTAWRWLDAAGRVVWSGDG